MTSASEKPENVKKVYEIRNPSLETESQIATGDAFEAQAVTDDLSHLGLDQPRRILIKREKRVLD